MDERLIKCPKCAYACELTWNFCSSCGKSLSLVKPEKVVYSFVGGKPSRLHGLCADDIPTVKSQNYQLVLAGYSIVKGFESDMNGATSFTPIATYRYEIGYLGQYQEVQNISQVHPPTQ